MFHVEHIIMEHINKERFLVLDSGVRVVMQSANSLVSYVCIFLNVGSRHDGGDREGAMHLIEHLLFKGTAARSYRQLMDYIESVGGDMNAYTSKEETCLHITIRNQYLERAIDVLSDIFYNSQFLEEEFLKEREVVLDELYSYEDSPQDIIYDDFEEYLFQKHELSHNILGTPQSLESISERELVENYNKYYTTDRLIISYVGSENLNKVEDLINAYFQKEKLSSASNITILSEDLQLPTFRKQMKKQTQQSHVVIGSFAPSMHHDDKTAMILLSNLLGGQSFNSLLNLTLREQNGLSYTVESNYTAYSDCGVFSVYFSTDKNKLQLCHSHISTLFESILSSGINEQELYMYKQQIVGQIAMSFDNYISLMVSNAKSYINYSKVDSYEEIITKIKSTSNDDIMRVAAQSLHSSALSILEYV